ncbi:hypothetical protein Tco_0411657 [Tanacetum coccineum]
MSQRTALNESKDGERQALNESKDSEKNGRVFLNLYLTQNSTAPNYQTNTTKIEDSLQNRAKSFVIEALKMALAGSPSEATDERCKVLLRFNCYVYSMFGQINRSHRQLRLINPMVEMLMVKLHRNQHAAVLKQTKEYFRGAALHKVS